MDNSCSTTVCGTGEWGGPAPGDPSTDVVLTATATYGGIQVAWGYPTTNPHAVAHTLLYRSTSDNVATAVELAVVSGSTYFDRIATEGNYFYWIKIVSVNGTVGAFVGPASATARNRGEDTVADLIGKIAADTLSENLKKDVLKITQTSEELRQEILDRIAANNALQGIVGGLQTDLEDAITYMGTESIERREGASAIVGEMLLIAAANAENAAAITEERTARVDALSAVVTDVTTLQAATEDYAIALQEEATIRAEETGALFAEKYVKIDLAGNVSGYGLSARVDPDGSTSNFRVSADKFSISSPNYVGTTAPPANMRHQGKVWIDTTAGAGNEVVRWWNAGTNAWSLVPIESAQPFVYYASPTTLSDGTIIQPGLYVNSALITKLRADQIDTRGLTIKDAEGNIIFGSGTGLDWGSIGGTNKPQDGATRNVFRGNWVTGSAYAVGDTVMDGGNGWSAKVAHDAVAGNRPPASGVGNTWWAAYTVKGADGSSGIDGLTIVAPNTSHTLPATSAGVVSSYTGSGTTIQIYEGSAALGAVASLTTTNSQFTVGTPYVSGTSSITVGGRTYSSITATVAQHSTMSSTGDECVITYPITLRRANGTVVNMSVQQTITKSRAGSTGATGSTGADGAMGPAGPKGDTGTQGIPGTPGANGVTLYTWVKYANDAVGTGISDSPGGKSYIGVAYNKTTATELDDPALYTWSLIKGDQGIQGPVGPQGSPTYTWIKYANDASGSGMSDASTGKTHIGIAVNKSTATEGTVASDYTWALIQGPKGDQGTQGIPGTPGATGTTLYTWIKYADSPTTGISDFPSGKAYIGVAYNKTTATESVAYADYSWSLIKGDQGIQGNAGTPGQTTYTWIKYADSSSGTSMSDSPTNKTYIGIAVNKTTNVESTAAADYTWALIQGPKGDTGTQGIQGPVGPQGQATYTWVKYADTPTTGISDFPSGKKYLGIAYNKTTATETETYSDYSWALIQGEQGQQGPAGLQGQATYTWVKYADDALGDGISDSPTNKAYIGIAPNKSTATESMVAADYTWSLFQGPQGIQGIKGTDGSTLYTWIKYADTPTTGISDFPSGKAYIGVAYNKTTASETETYADYSWSLIKGDQGIQGNAGTPGQTTYTWIKYADDATGTTGLSDSATGKKYIGIAPNKLTAVESTTPGDYTWALIQGPQGPQGEQGEQGLPGQGQVKGVAFFKSAAVSVSAPSGGSFTSPTPTTADWSDGVPAGTAPLWQSTRLFTSDGLSPQQATWTTPQKVANTTSVKYQFSLNNSTWSDTASVDSLYMRTGTSLDGGASWSYSAGVKIKGEIGPVGDTGPAGPALVLLVSRTPSFTATDGVLDAGQPNIVFTATLEGDIDPGTATYAWTVTGTQTQPALGNTASITLTAAQFGVATSAIVQCTVSGISDQVAVHRLNKSTAAAGATVGADGSNLKTGLGVNMVFNGDYTDGAAGTYAGYYTTGSAPLIGHNLASHTLQGEGTAYVYLTTTPAANSVFDADVVNGAAGKLFPVQAGKRYEVSAWFNSHRCSGAASVLFYNSSGGQISQSFANSIAYQSGISSMADLRQSWGIFTAPVGAVSAKVILRATATGAATPYLFFSRVYFGEAGAVQTEASAWSPGRGISQITPGNASTYIADASIAKAQMGVASIGSAQIESAAVDTLKVAGNAITAASTASVSISAGTDVTRYSNAVVYSAPANTAITVLVIVTGRTGSSSGSTTNLRRLILRWGFGTDSSAHTELLDTGQSPWIGDFFSMSALVTIPANEFRYFSICMENPSQNTTSMTANINFFAAKR